MVGFSIRCDESARVYSSLGKIHRKAPVQFDRVVGRAHLRHCRSIARKNTEQDEKQKLPKTTLRIAYIAVFQRCQTAMVD